MAAEAFRELLQDACRVRSLVALGALRDVAVLVVVALRAVHVFVTARGLGPFCVDLGVAGPAGCRVLFRAVGHHLRLVDRVAGGAGAVCLALVVRLVALRAGGLEAVRGVAACAAEQGVLARELLELRSRCRMAGGAGVGEPLGHADFTRGVRVGVAGGAVLVGRPVDIGVAGGALRHDLVVVPFLRVVRVDRGVALLAAETVPAAILLEVAELGAVALRALHRGERGRRGGVQVGLYRDVYRCKFRCECRGSGEDQRNQHQRQEYCLLHFSSEKNNIVLSNSTGLNTTYATDLSRELWRSRHFSYTAAGKLITAAIRLPLRPLVFITGTWRLVPPGPGRIAAAASLTPGTFSFRAATLRFIDGTAGLRDDGREIQGAPPTFRRGEPSLYGGATA
jgi:hypothetical protein